MIVAAGRGWVGGWVVQGAEAGEGQGLIVLMHAAMR